MHGTSQYKLGIASIMSIGGGLGPSVLETEQCVVKELTTSLGRPLTHEQHGQCRTQFMSEPELQSWSFNPKSSICYVSYDPLNDNSSEPQLGTYYGYMHRYSKPTEKITKQVDGLYYFFLELPKRNYTSAKTYCESRPGFHLPIIITQLHFQAAAIDIYEDSYMFWINLEDDPVQGLIWGNGISFNVTRQNTGVAMIEDNANEPRAFHMWEYVFHDYPTNRKQAVVCQGNFDDLPWQ